MSADVKFLLRLCALALVLHLVILPTACAPERVAAPRPNDSATADTACIKYTTSRDRLKIGRVCK